MQTVKKKKKKKKKEIILMKTEIFEPIFGENYEKFYGTSNNCKGKLQRNSEEILERFGAFTKICRGGGVQA